MVPPAAIVSVDVTINFPVIPAVSVASPVIVVAGVIATAPVETSPIAIAPDPFALIESCSFVPEEIARRFAPPAAAAPTTSTPVARSCVRVYFERRGCCSCWTNSQCVCTCRCDRACCVCRCGGDSSISADLYDLSSPIRSDKTSIFNIELVEVVRVIENKLSVFCRLRFEQFHSVFVKKLFVTEIIELFRGKKKFIFYFAFAHSAFSWERVLILLGHSVDHT